MHGRRMVATWLMTMAMAWACTAISLVTFWIDTSFMQARRRESSLDTGNDGKALRVVKVLSLWILNQKGQVRTASKPTHSSKPNPAPLSISEVLNMQCSLLDAIFSLPCATSTLKAHA